MNLFSKRKLKDNLDIQDKLLAAVVSLYLYMARTARLDGEEINFIDRILHSMFGNDIPLYKIEQARQQVISLRDAANFLSVHLGVADRTKIVLNLISLAYHDRGKIHVLGSLEIVELTDLLRLDVSNLDAIYDLFEDKLQVIDLPLAFHDTDKSYLRNSMLWAPVNGDYRFLGTTGKTRLLFIMIESLLLFYPETLSDNESCRIIAGNREHLMESKRFYRLLEDNILVLPGANGEIHLRNKDLWKIYNLGQNDREIPWQGDNTADIKLVYRKRKFYLESKVKSKLALNKELALDELIDANQPQQLIEILCQEHHNDETLLINADYYLCKDKQGYFLQGDNAAGAILHFYLKDEQLWLGNIGVTDIFLNRLPITGEMQFCLNQDIISIANTNYLINRSWELIEIPIQINELYVQEVSHRFKDGNKALNGISFRLPKGSMMAIMGPSGSGKTTLLQVLLGDIVATHSQISIDGMDFIA
ncbi:MAG: ATP-binding cassette domain-containing protein, partial [Candidatus Cloacimonas sp.]|nr:ATP-binding cassette domain-containing protein [Candidatus Cloacimonas sp.]